ncbi:MAG TPA: DUF4838 domain-containing protein [Candidatus Paceibacterota bacterium]|nr:DUF4838 domain-containing protein [Verrucomicrobiota bacterium]HRZ47620.1 DUF4838 domain-containing protein [Candidatus Paceibacterota bacterium]HRZ94593.1 DUF4838 domain-containing protein [Candidatus Paceibacterota bacterium]
MKSILIAFAFVASTAAAAEIEPGFTSMFNGKDLTGWEGKPGWWRVEDGCITAESTPQKPCPAAHYLMWRGGQPADFELRLEYRLVGGNSGVQFRSKELPGWDTSGYQADMEAGDQWSGCLFEHTRGGVSMRGEKVVIEPDGTRHVTAIGDSKELLSGMSGALLAAQTAAPIVLVKDGRPVISIVAGSIPEPVTELRHYLKEISGAELTVVAPRPGVSGIHVGTLADFPWLPRIQLEAQDLGQEGFFIRSDGTNLFLLGAQAAGVPHAVASFLDALGCRWFFPGKTWECIPRQPTIAGSWDQVSRPSFAVQRKIWYGFGTYKPCEADYAAWLRHNRLGGAVGITIGHTWHGLDPQKDFAAHPEWFALAGGQRKASKPCYSHPEVSRRAVEHALAQAERSAGMISMSPPDGLGYCECERCFAVFGGGAPEARHGTWFARRPDGVVVSAASETLFRFINQVAAAVAEKHPDTLIGAYAYSAYSHPPSFQLHPNVFVQTTTAFRRTDLSLEQQLDALKAQASQIGIRDYYSVYQWDWDYPSAGKLEPVRLQNELRFFHQKGVTSINAEASNNWGARGLGYYLAARLLWDVNADVPALLRDFYSKAFGPAADAIERHYARWYGPSASTSLGSARAASSAEAGAVGIPSGEHDDSEPTEFNVASLKASFRDLDEAAASVRDMPSHLARVNELRLYLHYLALRVRLDRAAERGDPQATLDAIQAETVFGGRLTYTHMIHTRPLLGKAFLRRFKPFEALLAHVPAAQKEGAGWRQVGAPPAPEELERLWAEDQRYLGL